MWKSVSEETNYMLLKNLMEEKQLDFNQPFLSVRRFSPTVSTAEPQHKRKTGSAHPRVPPRPPLYKSELKSGPVRNPGTVPFVWEQAPGRPKCESKPKSQALERPPVAPKLPPGRVLTAKQQALGLSSKQSTTCQSQMRNVVPSSQSVPSLDKDFTAEEKSKTGIDERSSSSGDDGEAYVDALDTLSRCESFFLNCSISGVSGFEGPELKPSGMFSTDPQTPDFMMGRFLPAAKAMASESPQYSIRKQPVPRQKTKVAFVQKGRPLDQNRLKNIPHYAQSNGVEESEDEDDDYDVPENPVFKACGLFPRLCLQNSICLVNPVPVMRKHNQYFRTAAYKQKPVDGFQKVGARAAKTKLNGGSNQRACKSHHQRSDGSSPCNLSLSNGRLTRPAKFSESPVNEGLLGSPEKCQNYGVTGCHPHAKGGSNFRELLEKERDEWESASASPAVEKTLFIDSVHMVKPGLSNSSSSDIKGLADCRSENDEPETLVKSNETEDTVSLDSSLQDVKNFNAVDEKAKAGKESFESVDSCCLSISDRSIHDVQMDGTDGSRQDQQYDMQVSPIFMSPKADKGRNFDLDRQPNTNPSNFEMSRGLVTDFMELTGTSEADHGKIDLQSHLKTRFSDQQTYNDCHPTRPLPPPLPKSPSESWLQRTLPSVSSKISSSRSLLGMRVHPAVQASEPNSLDPKWETIVKTSNLEHGHLRFSEELLTTIPEV